MIFNVEIGVSIKDQVGYYNQQLQWSLDTYIYKCLLLFTKFTFNIAKCKLI